MIIISSLRRSSLTCKHDKIFLFSSHKNEIGVLLLLHLISDRNPHIFNCRKIYRGGKNLVASCPGVAFATLYHPIATGLLWDRVRGLKGCEMNMMIKTLKRSLRRFNHPCGIFVFTIHKLSSFIY